MLVTEEREADATVADGLPPKSILQLQRDMLHVASTSKTELDLIHRLADALAKHARPIAGSFFQRSMDGSLGDAIHFGGQRDLSKNSKFHRQLVAACFAACRSDELEIRHLAAPPAVLIATAIRTASGETESLGILFEPGSPTEQLASLVQMMASHIVLWSSMAVGRAAESDARDAAALVELVERMVDAPGMRHACYSMAAAIQSHLGCLRVAVGSRHRGTADCRLTAISGTAQFDARSETSRALEAAMDEAIVRDDITAWPPDDGGQTHANLALKNLCSHASVRCAVSVPLGGSAGQTVGALTILCDSAETFATARRFAYAAQPTLSKAMLIAQRINGGFFAKRFRSASRTGRAKKRQWFVLAAVCILGTMLLPWPHKLYCDCQIEPITRRFVAAPFEGTLEKTLVKPGDVVREGDRLARMDGREIRFKRASVAADHSQAKKKRDAAQATHNYADQQIAQLEMERLEMELKLLDHRAENLEIRAPLSGVISSGDLERAEGAPLKTGQTLFEVGPLERMIVEVSVADAEISYIQSGQRIAVGLDAFPSSSWKAEVTSVQPRSEIRDEANVFLVEAAIENLEGRLRPGMKGHAKIFVGQSWLGWVLFHKSWEFASKKLAW